MYTKLSKFRPVLNKSFPILGLALCATSALAQAPAVVVDAQQIVGTGYHTAQSIAVSSNGTIYVADSLNNQVVALTTQAPGVPGVNNVVATGAVVLTNPQSLAIDANGDLFVGDQPSTGGRITELTGNGAGGLTGAATILASGGLLKRPISLAVDSTGTLFIGDLPSTYDGVIYSLAPGGVPTPLPITGLPVGVEPASLLRVSTNLYIVDNGDGTTPSGGVYEVPSAGGVAQKVSTSAFILDTPSGLTTDAAGNLYLLTSLANSATYNTGQQIIVIPAASPTTPYILPTTSLSNSSSMAFDPKGNLDVLELGQNEVTQLNFSNPVNLGTIPVNTNGNPVSYNIELNTPNTLYAGASGIYKFLTQGDPSNEIIQSGAGTCTSGKHTTQPNSGPTISALYPYICQQAFAGSPEFPGVRDSSIEIRGSGGAILASELVYDSGTGAVEISYPLNANATAIHLQVPQAVAVSGLNNRVYVADFQASAVYYTNGVAGANLTAVSTGTIALSAPAALALDGAGNLFIGDYNLAEVIEVPKNTAVSPFVINTGGLLTHPLAMTFDHSGNLYIGDAGTDGVFASTSVPGYVVKIPAGGTPIRMTIPSVPVIFPQALAIDPNTAALLIGDAGDPSGVGEVVKVSADASTAAVVPVGGVVNPTGLTFDPAEDLYVLDGTANTITVVPASGAAQYPVLFNNSLLIGASALASSAGGQSFIVANVGGDSDNSLVYLDGNRTSLLFGGVKVGNNSASMTATEYNIGNSMLVFSSPFYSTNNTAAFSVLNSSTCGNGLTLSPSGSCSINIQFAPTFIGPTSQQLTPQSNAYNTSAPSGAPLITLQGHGTASGAIKKK